MAFKHLVIIVYSLCELIQRFHFAATSDNRSILPVVLQISRASALSELVSRRHGFALAAPLGWRKVC